MVLWDFDPEYASTPFVKEISDSDDKWSDFSEIDGLAEKWQK